MTGFDGTINYNLEDNLDENGYVQTEGTLVSSNNTYTDSESQIPFNRVDFDNPISVLNYGKDILDKLATLMSNAAAANESTEIKHYELFAEADRLTDFNDFSEKKEKDKQIKLLPETGMLKSVKKGLNKIRIKAADELRETEAEKFNDERETLANIVDSVTVMMNENLQIIDMNTKLAKKMKPYIDTLKIAIEVGKKDLEKYRVEVCAPKEAEYEKTNDPLIGQEVQYDRLKIEQFESKLSQLEEQLVASTSNMQQLSLGVNNNMIIVSTASNYLTTVAPSLEMQVSLKKVSGRARNDLNALEKLSDTANTVYAKNAQILVGNIQKATELQRKGNIHTETIVEIEKNIKEGMTILQKQKEAMIQETKKKSQIMKSTLETFESYSQSLQGLSEMNDAKLAGLTEGSNGSSYTIKRKQ